MRMTPSKIAAAAALLALITVGAFPVPQARADSITIIPPKFEIPANPGDVITEKIKVRNDSSTEVTYSVEVEDFTATGDEGTVTFVDPETSKDNFSLAKWLTFEPTRFTVPAGQERIISFTIRVPRTGEPGGHYGTILVKRGGDTVPGGAAVDTRVGSLILLRVSGDITEKLILENFRPENGFQQFGPVTFNMRYKNEGNVHVAPTGTIVITNIFGKKVKEIPLVATNVLPDATRTIKATWEDRNLVGRYTASLVVNYGQEKQTLAGSTSFIVFPFYLMAIIAGVLVALYLLVTQRKAIKRAINNLTRD